MSDLQRSLGHLSLACLISVIGSQARAQSDAQGSAVQLPSAPISSPVDIEHVNYAYAQVLNVSPVYRDVRVPRQVEQCDEYDRIERRRPRDAGGTVLGAIIGGALGNQVGSGSGRAAATVAGAVVGGAIGREAGTETHLGQETRCHVIEEYTIESQLTGYDVEYRYRGEVFVSRLSHDPGDRLRIRVAVSPAENTSSPSSYDTSAAGAGSFDSY